MSDYTKEIDILASKINLIDKSLTDLDDDNLVTVIQGASTLYYAQLLDPDSITGIICAAYAAGRTRGRKESAMKEILEGSEDSG